MRKPARAPRFEYWQWRTTHSSYPLVVVWGDQSLEPVGGGSSVIVEECEHFAARELDCSITGRAKSTIVFICQNDNWYSPRWALVYEVFFALPQ